MATTSSAWAAPQWVNSFYSKFPLVTLEQEDTVEWRRQGKRSRAEYALWIKPPTTETHPHYCEWASADPACLRAQLLFLLRGIPVAQRIWRNDTSAPQGKLPTLHILKDNRLIPADDIRAWLDSTHPLEGKASSFHGMPSQANYDSALATAQLVLVRLLPAYYASLSQQPRDLALMLPVIPPLAAGLTTPLPASLTGDERSLEVDELIETGIEALDALGAKLGDGGQWAYDAESPTPLDALIASHLYCIYTLGASSCLRQKLEESTNLGQYVDSVLDYAARVLPQ